MAPKGPGTDRYLVFCPFPPCKHRTAPTRGKAELIAGKYAMEAEPGTPVYIYERISTARVTVEVNYDEEPSTTG